jgi:hypothetical protein
MAQQFNVLHIFGYGESQIIGEDYNKKVSTSLLVTAQPVIDNVYSTMPVGGDASAPPDFHAINIHYDLFADYQPNTGEAFRTQYSDLDATLIQAMVDEIYALP